MTQTTEICLMDDGEHLPAPAGQDLCPPCQARLDEMNRTAVDAYVMRRTATASPEACLQQLVRRAAAAVLEARDNPTRPIVGGPNVKAEAAADALIEAVAIATNGELTEADFVAYARQA